MVTSKHIALDGISQTIETQYRPQYTTLTQTLTRLQQLAR